MFGSIMYQPMDNSCDVRAILLQCNVYSVKHTKYYKYLAYTLAHEKRLLCFKETLFAQENLKKLLSIVRDFSKIAEIFRTVLTTQSDKIFLSFWNTLDT